MATLKISDLSVGDWVEIDHEDFGWRPAQINVCGDIGIGAYFKDIDPEEEYDCVLSQARPIPITAEILEKNGFESTTKPNVFTLTHGELQLYVSKELDGWYRSFVNFMERLCILQVIRKSYIHELQHALRLAGVDKEINL